MRKFRPAAVPAYYWALLVAAFLILLFAVGCPPSRPTVDVTVCATSGVLPNQYCPETIVRRFYVGEQPTAICAVHKVPEPPEPAPTVAVYVGVYDLMGAVGDVDAYLAACKANGAKGVRFFADCQWNWTGTRPYEYAAYDEATAELIRHKNPDDPRVIENDNGIMTLVRDSGARFPLFDYTSPRAEYWNYLRDVLTACKGHGLTAWVVMLDYCTLKVPGDAKYYSPWMCAVQRMLPGITDGTWGPQMREWVGKFYRQVWDVIKSVGCEFIIEDQNEGDALGWDDAFMVEWFKWSNATLRGIGVPVEKIATTVGRNVDKIAPLCGIYSPHGIGKPEQIAAIGGVSPTKMIYSSDGYWGGTGAADIKGKRGPGLDVANAIGLKIIQLGASGFEIIPRDAYASNGDRATLGAIDFAVVKAIAFAK